MEKTKVIAIEVPEDVHLSIKIEALKAGKTLREFVWDYFLKAYKPDQKIK